MGANMVRRLMRGGHECVVFDLNADSVKTLVGEGAIGAESLDDFVAKLSAPRAMWIMVPAGNPTEQTVLNLAARLSAEDIIIDGGNSYFKDDVRRSKMLAAQGINYVDVGTSGGIWGLERGYCMTAGGPAETVKHLDPIFKTLAPGPGTIEKTPSREGLQSTAEEGYLYCRAVRRRPFRQDGSQRQPVRLDASVCRRLRYFPQRKFGELARRHSL